MSFKFGVRESVGYPLYSLPGNDFRAKIYRSNESEKGTGDMESAASLCSRSVALTREAGLSKIARPGPRSRWTVHCTPSGASDVPRESSNDLKIRQVFGSFELNLKNTRSARRQ